MKLRANKWYPKGVVDDLILNNPSKIQQMGQAGYTMQFEPDKQRFRFVTLATLDREAARYNYTGRFEDPDPIRTHLDAGRKR